MIHYSIIPSFFCSKEFLIWLLLAIVIVGCQSGSKLDQPPSIRYGEDPCDECFMLINEERYASAYVNNQGQARRFDDIGCMLIYHNDNQEDVAFFWVKDFNTHKWLRVDNAVFIRSDSIHSPMGFGIIAIENENAAKDVQEKYPGKIIRFSELLEIISEELYY